MQIWKEDRIERVSHMSIPLVDRNKKEEIETPIRILIADGHGLFREGLRKLFEAHSNIAVIGQTSDGAEVLRLVQTLKPDILLLDSLMNNIGGLQVLRRLGRIAGLR